MKSERKPIVADGWYWCAGSKVAHYFEHEKAMCNHKRTPTSVAHDDSEGRHCKTCEGWLKNRNQVRP